MSGRDKKSPQIQDPFKVHTVYCLKLMKFIPALRHPKTNGTNNKEWQKFTGTYIKSLNTLSFY